MARFARFGQYLAGTLALCAANSFAANTTATESAKPNIILLISDDHRWDGLGVAGNPNVKTPNLDRMAKEGQWFREATIQIPLCSTSRAAILTGLPPSENGYYTNNFVRKDVADPHGFDQYKLLPKQLAKAGYHTAFAGKWHLQPDPWLCGFETIKRWMVGGAGPYRNPRLASGNSRETQPVQGFTQTIFTDDALEVLKKKADGSTTRPLFLWVAYTASHAPFQPNPKPISGMYDGKSTEELTPETFYSVPGDTPQPDQKWQHYYEAISALDAQVGRVMDTVRNSSLSTNTVVVLIGDNGFMMGRRGRWGKSVPYEDALRVPLIVWAPDSIMKSKGTTVTASANSIDLPPTFVKLAGATPPAEWVGRDLTPVLRDGKPHDITWAVSQYPNHNKSDSLDAYRVIRTPEHKLINWHPASGAKPELYDLTMDPAETTNLYGTPAVAETQARLEKQLADFRAKAGDDQWDMKGEVISIKGGKAKKEKPDRKKRGGKRNRRANR